MTARQWRFMRLFLLLSLFAGGVGLMLAGLSQNLMYFVTPSQLTAFPSKGNRIRLGGLVKAQSVHRHLGRLTFMVTDGTADVAVAYEGPVPDLFREGQGVVVEGVFHAGLFKAHVLYAKHDERYMPREVIQALKEQGQWRSS